MKKSSPAAAASPDAQLVNTGRMRTLLPEVFYRNPLPSAVNEVSAQARYIEVNDAWLAFFGLQREEVTGRPLREIEIWASEQQRRELRALLATQPRLLDREMRAKRRSGEEADVLVSWETFEDNGRQCMLWVFHDITERKQAERLLHESEQRFASIFGNSAQPMTLTRLADGVYLNVNRAFETLSGFTREEIIGRSSIELGVWPVPGVREELKRQFDVGQTVASVETQARMRSGRLLDIYFSATLIEIDGEKTLHGTVFDLTQMRQAVKARAVSEDRFAKVFAASPSPILIVQQEGDSYVDANQAWLDLYGFAREEIIGRTSAELNIWVDRSERDRLVGQASVRRVEVRHYNRAGDIIEVVESIEQIELDGRIARIVCVEDVTRQRRAERERAQMEERFAKVFEVGPHPIVFARASDGAHMQVNRAWHQLVGYTADDIRGQTSESLNLWVDAAFRERRTKLLARGEPVRNMETRMRTKSGSTVDVLISSEPLSFDGEQYVLTMMTDVTERRRADDQIQYLATRDQLTGLPNRSLFSDRLRQALARAARDKTGLALLFIDLDHFKDINDTLGHQAGDQLLMEVAARLSTVVRGADTLGRQGGDEFLLLLDGLANSAAAGLVAGKLVEALSVPFHFHGPAMKVSCSVGISVYPDDAANEKDLLRNADLAMYAAKESGRNGYRFYSPSMNQRLQERLELEEQLRGAVERGEFVLHYQPKVNFATGLVTGCEALVRWQRPGYGLWQPGRFVGAAEDARIIVPIGEWVLGSACRTLRRWIDAGLAPVPVACNLSVHQFSPALPEQLAQVLRETGVPGHLLQLEITESVMMTNAIAHLDTMRRIKALGVQIALDDFGTGYSSLSYLRHMDLDVLKIDRSFVHDLDNSADARAIVAAIVAMARSFNLKTVAEGVETAEQAQALRRMRCDDYQGFLFSQALPVEQFESQHLLRV